MRLLRIGAAAVLSAAVIVQAHASAQVARTPFDANRIVCGDEGARLIGDLRKEIAAAGQQTWTPAQERERLESDLKAVLDDREVGTKFAAVFPDLWKEATDFIQKPELVVAACAITLADAWHAGVRDVALLKQRWTAAQYTTYNLPGAASPTPSARTTDEDPSSSDPVDCVRVNDAPGSFRNDCDIPVYFTYCGVNPEEGSMTPDCARQKTVGLDGIKAGGVQGGFTRAETIYVFACRQPKTPKDIEFVPGRGLRGYCR